nr:L,D-transpeptidase family protein [Alteripontixanthobacter muriae]
MVLTALLAGCAAKSMPPLPLPEPVSEPAPVRPAAVLPKMEQARSAVRSILVDKSDRVLVLFEGEQPIRIYRDLQFGDAPMGHKQFQGDERTPEGRYRIDTRNPRSAYHLSLRISYPNAQDRAFANAQGRSPGGDIFLHGQPNGFDGERIEGDWTDGCIALSNQEIAELWHLVPDGTLIEIRP